MWKIDSTGVGRWQVEDAAWTVRAAGGHEGIGVARSGDNDHWCRFEPVGDDRLPVASEQYVRGRQWHVVYPQGDQSYALKAVFTPIEATRQRLILEATLSIQTSLLDTHPTLDLSASAADEIRVITPGGASGAAERLSTDTDSRAGDAARSQESSLPAGSAPIHVARSSEGTVAVLLGHHDFPFTQDRSSTGELRLRLFGDFLEKGVIRKTRPWIVIDRSDRPPHEDELLAGWKKLCDSPLPLMA